LARIAKKDWTMSDGTKVPAGTILYVNHLPLVMDDDFITNARQFDPWRMYRERQTEGEASKHQFVMTTGWNLAYGHGKHACPGRFFATNEIKTLLALLLMRYDFKATNISGGLQEVFKGRWYNMTRMPIAHAEIEFTDRSKLIPEDIRPWLYEVDVETMSQKLAKPRS
jgi:cytochrome P450